MNVTKGEIVKPLAPNTSAWIPVFGILLLCIMLFVAGKAAVAPGVWEGITYSDTSALSYISLALFVVVALFSVSSEFLYFTFLVFVLLAFPAPVNDFFPGVHLGDPRERGTAVFPFFTHIDLFLVLGILKALSVGRAFRPAFSMLLPLVLLGMFISIALNFSHFRFSQEQLLLLQGCFQFRYIVEMMLLFSFYRMSDYKNAIVIGLVVSILFLFVEANVYTRSKGLQVLISGSLANNVYASIVSAILLFLLVIKGKYQWSLTYRLLFWSAFAIGVLTIIATGARMAILAFTVCYFAYRYFDTARKFSLKNALTWIVVLSCFFAVVSILPKYLPKRYDPKTITERIKIKEPNTDLTKFIEIAPSWETSSLITRMKLYSASLKMIEERPLQGIGVGRWNFLKDRYGFTIPVLIDSHNGYLSFISQYGLLGLPILYFIYLYPLRVLLKRRFEKQNGLLIWLALINFFIAFSDLSNSASFKHQIFALLLFNALCVMQFEFEKRQNETVNQNSLGE